MSDADKMSLHDYYYDLPEELIEMCIRDSNICEIIALIS